MSPHRSSRWLAPWEVERSARQCAARARAVSQTRATHATRRAVQSSARSRPEVRARSQADLLDLRDVLVLLRVARALVLLEPEPSQVGNPTHGRIGRRRDFDEVEPGLLRPAQRLVDRHHSDLFAVFIDDPDLRHADLTDGTRAGRHGRTRVKGSTGYGRLPPYFFLGPLLTIGALGADLVRLPPFLDMRHLLSAARAWVAQSQHA